MLLCHMEHSYVAQPLQLRNTTMSQSRTDSESPIHDVWLRVKDINKWWQENSWNRRDVDR